VAAPTAHVDLLKLVNWFTGLCKTRYTQSRLEARPNRSCRSVVVRSLGNIRSDTRLLSAAPGARKGEEPGLMPYRS
jgi:hypothetical protein